MITFAFILSLIAIGASFVPIAGIVFGIIILIFSLVNLRLYRKISYKKGTIIIAIILSTIAVINSVIFTFYVNIFDKFLLANTTEIVDNTKYTRLIQDYSSLQTAINYTKGTSNSIKNIITMENTDIIKSTSDLASYPVDIRNMIAVNDNKTKYYNINFNNIKLDLLLTKKDCWVIDKNGKVYINLKDIKSY